MLLKKYLRVALLVALFLLLGEAFLRWGLGMGAPPLLQSDEDIGYLFQPNQDLWRFGHRIRINAYSQRNDDVTPLPSPGVLRILALGDSVTWGGVQVDQTQTFPAQLESLLGEALQIPVEVLNASAASWGIGNQTAYLRRFGALGARLVLWQIGTEDLYQTKSRGDAVGVSPFMPDRRPCCALGELFTRYILTAFTDTSAIPGYQIHRYEEAIFQANLTDFQEAVKQLQEQGIDVLVLHTPFRDEVWSTDSTTEHLPVSARNRFFELCAALQVPVVDLGAIWQAKPSEPGWFRDNIHLSAAGDRAVAEELNRFLRGKLLGDEVDGERNP